jgi:hypothetical protein
MAPDVPDNDEWEPDGGFWSTCMNGFWRHSCLWMLNMWEICPIMYYRESVLIFSSQEGTPDALVRTFPMMFIFSLVAAPNQPSFLNTIQLISL